MKFNTKNKTLRTLVISQVMIAITFLFLTIGNEVIDIPHYVFGDTPTSFPQRSGEIGIELSIFFIIMVIEVILFKKLYGRIKILEGYIPICAKCKKIRNMEEHWEQMEHYITEHSLALFSHSICPDCARELYPELYKDKPQSGRQKNPSNAKKPHR